IGPKRADPEYRILLSILLSKGRYITEFFSKNSRLVLLTVWFGLTWSQSQTELIDLDLQVELMESLISVPLTFHRSHQLVHRPHQPHRFDLINLTSQVELNQTVT